MSIISLHTIWGKLSRGHLAFRLVALSQLRIAAFW